MKKKKAKAAKKKAAGAGKKSRAGIMEPDKKNIQKVRSSVKSPRPSAKEKDGGVAQRKRSGASHNKDRSVGSNPTTPDKTPAPAPMAQAAPPVEKYVPVMSPPERPLPPTGRCISVPIKPPPPTPKPRPRVLSGETAKIKTGCGNIYVTINEDADGNPFELFMQIGKAGGCAASQTESIGRLASYALRAGMPLTGIMEQLRGIGCHAHTFDDGQKILSCADAIATALAAYLAKKSTTENKE